MPENTDESGHKGGDPHGGFLPYFIFDMMMPGLKVRSQVRVCLCRNTVNGEADPGGTCAGRSGRLPAESF